MENSFDLGWCSALAAGLAYGYVQIGSSAYKKLVEASGLGESVLGFGGTLFSQMLLYTGEEEALRLSETVIEYEIVSRYLVRKNGDL